MIKVFLSMMILCFAVGCKAKEKPTHVVNEQQNPRYLFVVSGSDGTFDGKQLVLNGVSSVVYFSDRPNRVAGHVSLQQFARIWDKEPGVRKGSLSILQVDSGQELSLDLKEVEVKGSTLSFSVETVTGDVPKNFKQSALFIDMESMKEDLFAIRDFHPLDCSCATIAEGEGLESIAK